MPRTFFILSLLPCLLLSVAMRAQDDPRRARVAAATERAVDGLRADIGAMLITPNLTVDDFLRRTGGSDELRKVLQRSQQIGEPRWIDDQTCQVKLEAAGDAVSAALVNIAASKPDRTPLPAEVLASELRGWKDRKFTATGTSASFERIRHLRPVRVNAWQSVSDDERQRAIAAARQDAVRRSLESVRSIEIAPHLSVADALSHPGVAEQVDRWFESRPINTVSFSEELEVKLTLSAPADEAFDAFLRSVQSAGDVKLPESDTEISRIRTQFVQRMAPPEGRARVAAAGEAPQPRLVELPAQPPAWITHQLDAEGQSSGLVGLRAKRAAEDRAMENLRAKLGALQLSEGLTIEEAARKDPRIGQAIERAMVRARVFKVDFDADGSVLVRVTIDARDVWNEIIEAR